MGFHFLDQLYERRQRGPVRGESGRREEERQQLHQPCLHFQPLDGLEIAEEQCSVGPHQKRDRHSDQRRVIKEDPPPDAVSEKHHLIRKYSSPT